MFHSRPQNLLVTLPKSLDARLIVALAVMVLLSLLAANTAALLILRDQLDRHSQSSLQQGQHTAALVLLERQRVLNDLVVVLSQRPTLRRLLAEDDRVALTDFLDGFRAQSDIDWILVCDSLQTARASSGEPIDAALCNLDSDTGYRLSDDRPVLTARAMVAENGTDSVVAGRWIDVSFLETLVNAPGAPDTR